jgi:hypothetical protein
VSFRPSRHDDSGYGRHALWSLLRVRIYKRFEPIIVGRIANQLIPLFDFIHSARSFSIGYNHHLRLLILLLKIQKQIEWFSSSR